MNQQVRGHLFALLTISIWSSTFVLSKIILETLTPLQVLLIRYGLAVFFLTLMYPKFKKPTSLKEELIFMTIGGSLVGYFLFENSALQLTYSSNVSLIVATIPLMTGFLSMFFLGTKFLTVRNVLGFVIAYSGVTVIIINGSRLEGVAPLGDALAFGAAVMFAVYSIVMEKAEEDYHLIQRTRKVFLYGFIMLLLIVVFSGQSFGDIKVTAPLGLSLVYLGLVASSLAFIMWNEAIHQLGPVRTNLYIYLVPVVTTVFARIILKEQITWLSVLGTLGILAGLYLSEHEEGDSCEEALSKSEEI